MKLPRHCVLADYVSPLGPMVLAAADGLLIGCWFKDQKDLPDLGGLNPAPQEPVLRQAIGQLQDYFDGQRRDFDVPMDLSSGTAFQQAVWHALREIGPVQRCTYGDIARRIARPKAVRAVGAAIGRNPIAILVPCHRVVGADGSLTGYTGGLQRKAALLHLEGGA